MHFLKQTEMAPLDHRNNPVLQPALFTVSYLQEEQSIDPIMDYGGNLCLV